MYDHYVFNTGPLLHQLISIQINPFFINTRAFHRKAFLPTHSSSSLLEFKHCDPTPRALLDCSSFSLQRMYWRYRTLHQFTFSIPAHGASMKNGYISFIRQFTLSSFHEKKWRDPENKWVIAYHFKTAFNREFLSKKAFISCEKALILKSSFVHKLGKNFILTVTVPYCGWPAYINC